MNALKARRRSRRIGILQEEPDSVDTDPPRESLMRCRATGIGY